MATWTTRETRTTYREWVIPCPWPQGAALGDLLSALTVAEAAYRRAHGLPPDAAIPDDALRVLPGDEDVVIRLTLEDTTTADH